MYNGIMEILKSKKATSGTFCAVILISPSQP